jgi:hypothetical protein
LGQKDIAQVTVEDPLSSFQPNCPLNELDGHVGLAYLESNHPQKMNRVGLIRFARKNLTANLFGIVQTPSLMALGGNRK